MYADSFWKIARVRSVFFCLRSFYPSLNEKAFLLHCKCGIETRFSRCSHPKNLLPLQYLIICFEHVDVICLAYYMKRVEGNLWIQFSHHVILIKIRSHRWSGAFLHVWNYLKFTLACIYVSFFPNILGSCDCKFVFHFWTPARCNRTVVTVVNIIAAHDVKLLLPNKKLDLITI